MLNCWWMCDLVVAVRLWWLMQSRGFHVTLAYSCQFYYGERAVKQMRARPELSVGQQPCVGTGWHRHPLAGPVLATFTIVATSRSPETRWSFVA